MNVNVTQTPINITIEAVDYTANNKPEPYRVLVYKNSEYIEPKKISEDIILDAIYCDEFIKNYTGTKKVGFYIDSEGTVSLTKPNTEEYYAIISQMEFRIFNVGKHIIDDNKLFTENYLQLDNLMKIKNRDCEISRKIINVKSGKVIIAIKDGVSIYDNFFKYLGTDIKDELNVLDFNKESDDYLNLSYLYPDNYNDKTYTYGLDLEIHMKGLKSVQRVFEYSEADCYLLYRDNPFTSYLKTPHLLIPFLNPKNLQPVLFFNNRLLHINPHIIKRGSQSFILLNLEQVYKIPEDELNYMWRNIMMWYEQNKDVTNLFTIVLRDKFKFFETSLFKADARNVEIPIEIYIADNKEVYVDGYLLEEGIDYNLINDKLNLLKAYKGKELITITYGNTHKRYKINYTSASYMKIIYNDYYFKEFYIDGLLINKRNIWSLSPLIHLPLLTSNESEITVIDYRDYNADKYYRCHCGETIGKDNFNNDITCSVCGFKLEEKNIYDGDLTMLLENNFLSRISDTFNNDSTWKDGKSTILEDNVDPTYTFTLRRNDLLKVIVSDYYEPNLRAVPVKTNTILNKLTKPTLPPAK